MNTPLLERYYEKTILPQFDGSIKHPLAWKDHGRVNQETYAHYFETPDGTEYILINEDYPGDYMSDNLTHDMVPLRNGESAVLTVDVDQNWTPNISGYFTLYKEKTR